jgi:hypothetical protein
MHAAVAAAPVMIQVEAILKRMGKRPYCSGNQQAFLYYKFRANYFRGAKMALSSVPYRGGAKRDNAVASPQVQRLLAGYMTGNIQAFPNRIMYIYCLSKSSHLCGCTVPQMV